jgi:uncharacterized LabA/DUF88 family protein
MKTIVYIDGFNLYYRCLRGTANKWLNIEALSKAVLPKDSDIQAICYYTARVSGRTNKDSPKDQHAYLRAISTLPTVSIYYGNFIVSKKWAGLVDPPTTFKPLPQVAWVWKTEEKGSDVNLGVHLVRDAYKGLFDRAVVLTNDTDLVEPIRIVTEECQLEVILLNPNKKGESATSLKNVATSVRHIAPYVSSCQFPAVIPVAGKSPITKPSDW